MNYLIKGELKFFVYKCKDNKQKGSKIMIRKNKTKQKQVNKTIPIFLH